jgi:hypothetical protein
VIVISSPCAVQLGAAHCESRSSMHVQVGFALHAFGVERHVASCDELASTKQYCWGAVHVDDPHENAFPAPPLASPELDPSSPPPPPPLDASPPLPDASSPVLSPAASAPTLAAPSNVLGFDASAASDCSSVKRAPPQARRTQEPRRKRIDRRATVTATHRAFHHANV